MNVLSLTLVLGTLLAASDTSSPPPVSVNVVAVCATQENRPQKHFDPGLDAVRDSIVDIEADTYRKVCSENVTAPFGKETRVVLTPKYALFITPVGKGPRNQVRLTLTIQKPPKADQDKSVNVISTTVLISPDKQFRIRGLHWNDGELIVIVSIRR